MIETKLVVRDIPLRIHQNGPTFDVYLDDATEPWPFLGTITGKRYNMINDLSRSLEADCPAT